ncbi:terminase small subunit [Variovorax sp. PMC12]|uniref:terminase small subunit n=1 Tax=Variovorax sp. PMC12 TaxID=2126319 RepID=UPI000D120ABE|nr:terminase small subunit [Variovorax sp. PMC12]AVQ84282.1 terminase [Variovorax sp. PMC12]
MAKPPAGKKPAPRKIPSKPAVKKKTVGVVAPARKKAPAKAKAPVKPAPRKRASKPEAPAVVPVVPLTEKQQRFVDEYLVDLNATQAAIRAGYSAATANEQGAQLLAKLSIQTAVAAGRKAQQERTQISADRVVTEAWNIVTADPRELVEVKVGCCRHCWGEGHKYQRTLAEYNRERELHRAEGKPDEEWEEKGGIGFDPLKDPHPSCPDCSGDGHARTTLKDTRYLSPQALALYAGAKQGKYGIEVLMHDKGVFAEKLFKHLGLYEKDNQQKTDPLAALLHAIAKGSGNAFKPVAEDPERTAASAAPSAFMPRADDPEED